MGWVWAPSVRAKHGLCDTHKSSKAFFLIIFIFKILIFCAKCRLAWEWECLGWPGNISGSPGKAGRGSCGEGSLGSLLNQQKMNGWIVQNVHSFNLSKMMTSSVWNKFWSNSIMTVATFLYYKLLNVFWTKCWNISKGRWYIIHTIW